MNGWMNELRCNDWRVILIPIAIAHYGDINADKREVFIEMNFKHIKQRPSKKKQIVHVKRLI